jgi:hypothetical protein
MRKPAGNWYYALRNYISSGIWMEFQHYSVAAENAPAEKAE